MRDGRSRAPEAMAGLAKGIRIIELFNKTGGTLTVTAAANAIGISRASASRCLLTLMDLGYLDKEGDSFRPTLRILRLGSTYGNAASLPQLAQRHLEAARSEFQETVSLAVMDDWNSVFVARAETSRLVSSVIRLGIRLPAFCSASGRVLLSSVGDTELEDYFTQLDPQALTPKTNIDTAKLKAIVLQTKQDGFAISDQEVELGLISLAVPVIDPDGAIVAAMTLSASSVRISAEHLREEIMPRLREYADELANKL